MTGSGLIGRAALLVGKGVPTLAWLWIFYAIRGDAAAGDAVVYLLGPATLVRGASEYAEGALRKRGVTVSLGAVLAKCSGIAAVLVSLSLFYGGGWDWIAVAIGASAAPVVSLCFDLDARGRRLALVIGLNVLSAIGAAVWFVALGARPLEAFGAFLIASAVGSFAILAIDRSFARETSPGYWLLGLASVFAATPRLLDIPLSIGWADQASVVRNAFVVRVANQAARIPQFLNSYLHVAAMRTKRDVARQPAVRAVTLLAVASGVAASLMLRRDGEPALMISVYVFGSVLLHYLGEAFRVFSRSDENLRVVTTFSLSILAIGFALRLLGVNPLLSFVSAYLLSGAIYVRAWRRLLRTSER